MLCDMSQLADLFGRFLHVVKESGRSPWLLVDDLRFPAGDSGTLRGSPLGAQLWATPEGTALLDYATADAEVQAVFEGNWFLRWETRHIFAQALVLALADARDADEWANNAEEVLWQELRRRDVVGRAVAVVEGVLAPPGGLMLPHWFAILPPADEVIGQSFARAWPRYRTHLPSGPFSLLYASVSVPRRLFSGFGATIWARIGVMRLRDAIWLATGMVPTLGHGVAWEESPFPIAEPNHSDPESTTEQRDQTIEVGAYARELTAIIRRFQVVSGGAETVSPLDADTLYSLRNIRDQADVALRSAGSRFPTFLAFSAANGSLHTASDYEGNTGFVAVRFGQLCGRTDEEAEQLTRAMQHLQLARRAVAHGSQPRAAVLDRFIGASEVTPANADDLAWYTDEQRYRDQEARARALELLRRLFVAYLAATLRVTDDDHVDVGLTRAALLALVQDAQRNVRHARERLRAITAL